jgi:hypothetical protein
MANVKPRLVFEPKPDELKAIEAYRELVGLPSNEAALRALVRLGLQRAGAKNFGKRGVLQGRPS